MTLTVIPGEPVRGHQRGDRRDGPGADRCASRPERHRRAAAQLGLACRRSFSPVRVDVGEGKGGDGLAATPYAAAKLVASEAKIDPEAKSAALSVAIESGPAFHFGDIEVRGLDRYTPELVKSFSTIKPGDLFGERPLDEFVRRLLASGYFASVQASIVPDPEHAEAAPLTMAVIEAPPKRLEVGLGYSTDTQWKASGNYSDVNIDGHGLQFYADARIETKSHVGQRPLRAARPHRAAGSTRSRSDSSAPTSRTSSPARRASRGAGAPSTRPARRPSARAIYLDQQEPQGASTEDSHALYVDGEYTWRRVDNLLQPERGYMANVQVGAGVPGASTRGFGRVIGKVAAWWPLDRNTQLYARARRRRGAGRFARRHSVEFPVPHRRRHDGARLRVRQPRREIGRCHRRRPLLRGGQRRGHALDRRELGHSRRSSIPAMPSTRCTTSTLPGDTASAARLRTPIGPFRVDVAYGQQSQSVRVHFSVGLSF